MTLVINSIHVVTATICNHIDLDNTSHLYNQQECQVCNQEHFIILWFHFHKETILYMFKRCCHLITSLYNIKKQQRKIEPTSAKTILDKNIILSPSLYKSIIFFNNPNVTEEMYLSDQECATSQSSIRPC